VLIEEVEERLLGGTIDGAATVLEITVIVGIRLFNMTDNTIDI
jgi:hypothetical protein